MSVKNVNNHADSTFVDLNYCDLQRAKVVESSGAIWAIFLTAITRFQSFLANTTGMTVFGIEKTHSVSLSKNPNEQIENILTSTIPSWKEGLKALQERKGYFLGDASVNLTLELLERENPSFHFISTQTSDHSQVAERKPSDRFTAWLNGNPQPIVYSQPIDEIVLDRLPNQTAKKARSLMTTKDKDHLQATENTVRNNLSKKAIEKFAKSHPQLNADDLATELALDIVTKAFSHKERSIQFTGNVDVLSGTDSMDEDNSKFLGNIESVIKELNRNALVSANEEFKQVAIPFDNHGHIVMLFVDFETNRIEYYDPKGATSNAPEAKRYGNQLNLRNELLSIQQTLVEKTGRKFRIVENIHQHQENKWSSAVYCIRYVQQRLKGKSAEAIHHKSFGNSAIIKRQARIAKETSQSLEKMANDPRLQQLASSQTIEALGDEEFDLHVEQPASEPEAPSQNTISVEDAHRVTLARELLEGRGYIDNHYFTQEALTQVGVAIEGFQQLGVTVENLISSTIEIESLIKMDSIIKELRDIGYDIEQMELTENDLSRIDLGIQGFGELGITKEQFIERDISIDELMAMGLFTEELRENNLTWSTALKQYETIDGVLEHLNACKALPSMPGFVA